jgi:UDP-N-acetylmuramyl pentapeptide phosphotransferase/UDP-N-acetylglucosamine-1-phosphate transferase
VTTALAILLVAGCAGLSWLSTWRLIPRLVARGVLDRPNERSSHARPVPRGGGLAPVAVAVLAWLGLGLFGKAPWLITVVVLGAAALLALGWFDDRRGLAPAPRLALQAAAVAAGLAALPTDAMPWIGVAALGFAWLWHVNLTNFMDGTDGLAAGNTVMVALGVALVTAMSGQPGLAWPALALGGAALGFLPWNWAPARVFLGDAGSVPLGFLAGWLLLDLALSGAIVAALILPLVFVADATTTLLWRLARGERPWRAHRDHAYQTAIRNGRSHAWVATRVIALDAVLVGLATLSLAGGVAAWAALGTALVSVAGTLWYFRRAAPP